MSEIADGMSVTYMDQTGGLVPTKVEDATILENKEGPGVRLANKHNAAVSRIIVSTTAQAQHETAAMVPVPGEGTEVAAAVEAAVDTERAAVGASTAAVGADPTFNDSDMHDTNNYLKSAVAPWIESMKKEAEEQEVFLPVVAKQKLLSFLTH